MSNALFTESCSVHTTTPNSSTAMHHASRIPFFTRSCFYAPTRPRLRTRFKIPSQTHNQPNTRQFSSTPPVQYATHPGSSPASSLLTQTLDQRERLESGRENFGPFTIGISHKPLKESEKKKWSELDMKGKGMAFLSVAFPGMYS